MRRHLSYANVVATLALVFAMSGGALAAKHYLVSSPKQISPKVLKSFAKTNTSLFKKLSKTVTVTKATTATSAATAGFATSASNATNAANATNAGHAATADSAPLPQSLASGKSERGIWAVVENAPAATSVYGGTMSFAVPLASAPTAHFIPAGGVPPAGCSGSVSAPAAAPGNLCVFTTFPPINLTQTNFFDPETFAEKPAISGKSGAVVVFNSGTAGEAQATGTYAVTAP